jgi:RNA ligase (TIGR02306 family)
MERKLASIRKISDIQEIPGADMIELVIVDGWKVVVAKNVGHKVGDLVVYCEIDSFLPIKKEFEFLRKSSYKKMSDDSEGFRLRTIKLRGQVSQGLILPLDVLLPTGVSSDDVYEGLDVTGTLNIKKYEPPIPAELAGKVKGLFPSFIQKTDEERIQNLSDEYESFKNSDKEFYVTEKLDGSSATFYYNNGEFGVCSRNLELLETEGNTFWKVARKMKLEEKLSKLGLNISIQGELIGEGIQGNPYKIKGHTVRFFNVFDIDNHQRMSYGTLNEIIVDKLGLQTVPVTAVPGFKLPNSIDELLKMAEAKSVMNDKAEREGIVIRSRDNEISFKVISNKFLLKEK